MRRLLVLSGLMAAVLAAMTLLAPRAMPLLPAGAAEGENPFPGRFDAPELNQGGEWLNTAEPIDLADLRGKVVLLDFWTYACINCIHVLPDLHQLEQDFPEELVVVGVHVPKFDNEQQTDNIREAILRYEIEHPVVNDAGNKIAREYGFRSWPTLVLIDPEGQYVGYLSGEGNYATLKKTITEMIAFHKSQGTLKPSPNTFELERETVEPTPLRFPGKVLATGGRLFVSDSNHNRIVVAAEDGTVEHVIGSGEIGLADGDFAAATFDHPQGMALVGSTLYVADTENHAIRTVDLDAGTVSTLVGNGEQARFRSAGGPLADAQLNSPWDLLELDGTLYIAMAGPHQLWSHPIGSDRIGVFAGTGREDITDGTLQLSALAQPSGLATDGITIFFVDSEGSAIRKATPQGKPGGGLVATIAGPRGLAQGRALFEFGLTDGAGPQARFQHPLGIAYHDGRLIVADTYNHVLRQVALPGGETTTWAGTGKDGDSLDPLQLDEPAGLSATGGAIYVADTNNHRILRIDATTKAVEEVRFDGLKP